MRLNDGEIMRVKTKEGKIEQAENIDIWPAWRSGNRGLEE